jgi:cytochrome c biogenesis protein CcmG, thiol:disulfide interchange protein DsbE
MTMRRSTLRWLVLPAVVLPVTLLFAAAVAEPTARVGEPAPTFELQTIDGETISSEDLRGQAYALNFWASWCVPACVDEHPVLIEAHERHGDEVLLIGVLVRDSPEGARSFLERYGDGGWPHLLDPGGRLGRAYGSLGPPETYFVDRHGILRARQIGPMNGELMRRQFAALLAPVEAAP